jgi:hypothetical protein
LNEELPAGERRERKNAKKVIVGIWKKADEVVCLQPLKRASR